MFDRITIEAKVSEAECAHLEQLHSLERTTSHDGRTVSYKSNRKLQNITGVFVSISSKNILKLSLSLHKYWHDRNFGGLRNDNVFTLSEAKSAIEWLMFENGLTVDRIRVTNFEIGINLQVIYEPKTFIELVKYIPRVNSNEAKPLWVDANWRPNRQQTTEKSKYVRKYYKIYDKTWEMGEKKKPPSPGFDTLRTQPPSDKKYILRLETVYRRYRKKGDEFFSDANMHRLATNFFFDWKNLKFVRDVRAYKGARKSEIDAARNIINIGAEEYAVAIKEELDKGILTPKQYRTLREFIRDFDKNADKFETLLSPQEREYQRIFTPTYYKFRQ